MELNQISDQKVLEMRIAEYNQHTTELWEALMMLEMQLVDQLEVQKNIKEMCIYVPLYSCSLYVSIWHYGTMDCYLVYFWLESNE